MAYKQIIQKNIIPDQVDASDYTGPRVDMYLARTYSVQVDVSAVTGGATVAVNLQVSNDGVNFVTLNTESRTADSTFFFSTDTSLVFFKYVRVVKDIDVGSANVKAYLLAVGDDC